MRRSYDTVAEEYAARMHDELTGKPLDRALLAALLEQTEPGGTIADLGCGAGHVAAWLAGHGARAVGIDLSAGMVAVGRRRFAQVEFREGDLLALPARDGEFSSAVAFYSVIHLAPDDLRRAFDEAKRVLGPSGLLLLSFHVGKEARHLDEGGGTPWTSTTSRPPPPGDTAQAIQCGRRVTADDGRPSASAAAMRCTASRRVSGGAV
ncbi:class I SAM-dependent methyltransferase [Streptomyces paromomycinus]|uniref:class I SAM-dependent methyltransferase n=1 Tax=Streptomyces paromomycinus TaxID=92743 RepID=UPI001FEB74DB|nr:class I SAM-dependent methyltransferase [Streptomyces paromomycinus]